jgi:hypothetical protein
MAVCVQSCEVVIFTGMWYDILYKLFENAEEHVAREAGVRDRMRFRRQQVSG